MLPAVGTIFFKFEFLFGFFLLVPLMIVISVFTDGARQIISKFFYFCHVFSLNGIIR